jgi:L-asparaginase
MARRPRIGVFSLAGTIDDVSGLDEVAEVTATTILALPGIDLTFRDVVDLAGTVGDALAAGMDGAVVALGAETLEETSFLLDLLHAGDQPLVTTDPADLLAAVRVAASGVTGGRGVAIAIGEEVRPAALASELGPRERFRLPERPRGDARVGLVGIGLGDDGEVLRNLRPDRFDGLVVDAAGGGRVAHPVAEQIRGLAETMPVAVASRTRAGTTLDHTGGELDLLERGAIVAGRLDAPKARVLMLALLAGGAGRAQVGRAFEAFGGRWLVLQRTDA